MDHARPVPQNDQALVDLLTTPSKPVLESIGAGSGDLLIVGAGGKMGPTLALLAQRAVVASGAVRKVIAVSRFSDPGVAAMLRSHGVETISADIMDRAALEALPPAATVYFLAGAKFGTASNPGYTWATNTILPANIAERYRDSRIIALSTGNVYPMTPISSRGASEATAPAPVGEYAQSCLGRERVLEYCSSLYGARVLLVRLNYACDLRYGVPVDIAQSVADGRPVDISMGAFNVLWQGDANGVLLRAAHLAASPPAILNLTGPDVIRVRDAAQLMADHMGVPRPALQGEEGATALLSDASECVRRFGPPQVDTAALLRWTAEWVAAGRTTLGKPTHFQVRDGRF